MLLLAAAVIALFVFFDWVRPMLAERRTRRLIGPREPMDAIVFAETYFNDVPGGLMCAATVRRHLEEHIGVDLCGLRPDDRLTEINAELDPVFFELLGKELGIAFPTRGTRDYPHYCEMLRTLKTVRDLVELAVRYRAAQGTDSKATDGGAIPNA